jgi:hypothetical protein
MRIAEGIGYHTPFDPHAYDNAYNAYSFGR